MTSTPESQAREFLLQAFRHNRYRFENKTDGESGFDLWMIDQVTGDRTHAELKAHTGKYQRPRDLVDRLIFNSTKEKELFESGNSVLIRVFLGSMPQKVFIVTNRILGKEAKLIPEARYVLRGKVTYDGAYEELA